MRILSLDTTAREGSAAIVEDDRVIEVRRGDASRSHAERLPSELIALLEAHALSFADVDVFAVASGPGSFTGLRIGIATIQGLAFTRARRVVAVSALEALAHTASVRDGGAGNREPGTWNREPGTWNREPGTGNREPGTGNREPETGNLEPGTLVVAWMDAFRREVFAATYRIANAPPFDSGRLRIVEAAQVGAPADFLKTLRTVDSECPIVFTGDGAVTYVAQIADAFPSAIVQPAGPIAGAIGLMALARARRGETIDPAAIQPLYVRRPDAEVARDARQ